jgi:hypothetical protein
MSVDCIPSGGRSLLVAFVEPVVGPTREDVLVKVPDVLAAARFVVLARGDAIAGIRRLHSDRDALGDRNEVDAERRWELVEVLEVEFGITRTWPGFAGHQ